MACVVGHVENYLWFNGVSIPHNLLRSDWEGSGNKFYVY